MRQLVREHDDEREGLLDVLLIMLCRLFSVESKSGKQHGRASSQKEPTKREPAEPGMLRIMVPKSVAAVGDSALPSAGTAPSTDASLERGPEKRSSKGVKKNGSRGCANPRKSKDGIGGADGEGANVKPHARRKGGNGGKKEPSSKSERVSGGCASHLIGLGCRRLCVTVLEESVCAKGCNSARHTFQKLIVVWPDSSKLLSDCDIDIPNGYSRTTAAKCEEEAMNEIVGQNEVSTVRCSRCTHTNRWKCECW